MRTPGTVHAVCEGIAHTSGRAYEISPVCVAGGYPGVGGAPVLQVHAQSLALMQLTTGHIPWGQHVHSDQELA